MVINENMSFWQKILRPKVIFLNVSKSLYHSDVLFEFSSQKYLVFFVRSQSLKVVRILSYYVMYILNFISIQIQ